MMWKTLAIGAAGVTAAGLGLMLRSEYEKNHFVVEELPISSSKILRERTLVFLTDVHDKEFGPANQELFQAICQEKPDEILIGGDVMISRGEGNLDAAFRLLRGLTSIAPVYYAFGNHEMRLGAEREKYGTQHENLLSEAKKLGVTMLINRNLQIGEDLAVAGINLHPIFYEKLLFKKPVPMPPEYLAGRLGRADKKRMQILLMHSPLYFQEARIWGADLTLSGHFHGGTIRIPGLGGLMTPQYQFLLPWCAGSFQRDGKWMAVGRGLGTHSINIRLNDRPQVLVIRLMPKNKQPIQQETGFLPETNQKKH